MGGTIERDISWAQRATGDDHAAQIEVPAPVRAVADEVGDRHVAVHGALGRRSIQSLDGAVDAAHRHCPVLPGVIGTAGKLERHAIFEDDRVLAEALPVQLLQSGPTTDVCPALPGSADRDRAFQWRVQLVGPWRRFAQGNQWRPAKRAICHPNLGDHPDHSGLLKRTPGLIVFSCNRVGRLLVHELDDVPGREEVGVLDAHGERRIAGDNIFLDRRHRARVVATPLQRHRAGVGAMDLDTIQAVLAAAVRPLVGQRTRIDRDRPGLGECRQGAGACPRPLSNDLPRRLQRQRPRERTNLRHGPAAHHTVGTPECGLAQCRILER